MRAQPFFGPLLVGIVISGCVGGGGSSVGGQAGGASADESNGSQEPNSILVGSVPGDTRVTDNLMIPSGEYLRTEGGSNMRDGIHDDVIRVRYNDDGSLNVVIAGNTSSYVYRFSPMDNGRSRSAGRSEDTDSGLWAALGLPDDFDPQDLVGGDDMIQFLGEANGAGGNRVLLAQVAPDDAYFVMSALADLDIRNGGGDVRIDRQAFFVLGEETNNAAGNLSGSARYKGTAYAVRTQSNNNRLIDSLAGTADLNANFTTNRVSMEMALESSNGGTVNFIAEPWPDSGVNMGGSSFWMQLLGDGIERGEAKGRFYGPNAANAAGIFQGEYNDNRRIDGVFGTTRQ